MKEKFNGVSYVRNEGVSFMRILHYTDVVKAYDKMKAASVEARLHVGEKMDHVYPVLPTPEGKAARKEIAKILSVW